MAVIKCKMCGGDLHVEEGNTVCECEYCGTRQTVPTADNEKKMTLFTRASRLLRNCEFDKASGVFETIVGEFPEEAEAYWGLVLCKYGIEYVDDPATGKKIPTCHRSSFESVLDDSNFEQACENTDAAARRFYRDEARQIESLRQAILEISGKEEPYDIFISYKEKDENGERTEDSVIAQDIYKELTDEGYRVFFSRITLESKLGTEYEPYIFAALNSAKVMLVVGTDYENFDSVWVKNEWSRFLKLIAAGEKKTLIPVFRNMDAYDMPKEFSRFAAQDMGKVGAMQDLLHGVGKILRKRTDQTASAPQATVDAGLSAVNAQTSAMMKRGYMMLHDGDYKKADDFFERVLNNDAECAQAYWGKTLAEAKVPNAEQYGAVTLFNHIREKATTKTITIHTESVASLARKADEEGLLKEFPDEELAELLSDIDNKPVQVESAFEYYRKQEKKYTNIKSLHQLAGSHDYDRAAKFADDYVLNAETTALQALRVSINQAIKEEEKKESDARSEVKRRENETIAVVRGRLINVSKEYEKHQNEIEATRKESERKSEQDYQAALEQFERDYNDAIEKQNSDYQVKMETWKRAKFTFDEDHTAVLEARSQLQENINQLVAERDGLKGLFTGRRRKELDNNIEILVKKLDETIIPEEPGPMPERPAPLQKGIPPKREDFIPSLLKGDTFDVKEEIKCGLSPVYKAHRDLIRQLRQKKIGDELQFGSYYFQEDEATPIIWQVLAKEDNRLLVISKYALDCQPYNTSSREVTWETCTLRKWLNGTFLNDSFNAEEQAMISAMTISANWNPSYSTGIGNLEQDKVFLLSIPEVNKYFNTIEALKCVPTDYAIAQGAYTSNSYKLNGKATCWWWLRSPGTLPSDAAYVYIGGSVYCNGNIAAGVSGAVRPALWINLNS